MSTQKVSKGKNETIINSTENKLQEGKAVTQSSFVSNVYIDKNNVNMNTDLIKIMI